MIPTKNPPSCERWASSTQDYRSLPDAKSVVKSNTTPIRYNGKVIGEVQGDVFFKNVIRQKHLFRNFVGYSFDLQTLQQAEQAGAKFVQNREVDTGDTYKVSIETIYQFGVTLPDKGYGKQICLPLKYWVCEGKSSIRQLSFGW